MVSARILVVVLLLACAPSPMPDPSQESSPESGQPAAPSRWTVQAIEFDDAPALVPPGATEITFNSDLRTDGAGQVDGNVGCNRLFGSYEVSGGELAVSGLGSTRMACEDTTMEFERAFMRGLAAAHSLEAAAGVLVIRFGGGALRLQRAG